MAEPGGICASAAALEGTEELPVRVRSLGRKRLKNIPEPVLAYEIVDDELPTDERKPWRRRIPTPQRPSLAVSPFVNLGEPEDVHFADGLMIALTIELMTIPGLDVISENSTLGYRDQPRSAQQIGHDLGVQFVLEGAVQRSGSRVRVLTQLVDVAESATVWADRFEADFSDVFAAQDDIVAKIVETLDIEIVGDLAHTYRDELDSESVEIVYRGLHEMAKSTPDSLRRANGLLRGAHRAKPRRRARVRPLGLGPFLGGFHGKGGGSGPPVPAGEGARPGGDRPRRHDRPRAPGPRPCPGAGARLGGGARRGLAGDGRAAGVRCDVRRRGERDALPRTLGGSGRHGLPRDPSEPVHVGLVPSRARQRLLRRRGLRDRGGDRGGRRRR